MKEENMCLIDNYFPVDYTDAYSQEINCSKPITPEEFYNITFNQLPKWISWLMSLRNSIVKPLGLDTKRRFTDMIYERNSNEIIFGMPDKHLTFYVSMWCSNAHNNRQILKITILVKYNNTLGRIYFFFIRPFHKIIISSLLRRIKDKYQSE